MGEWWVHGVRLLQTPRFIQCLQPFSTNIIQHSPSKVGLTLKKPHVIHRICKGSSGQPDLFFFFKKGISLDCNPFEIACGYFDKLSRTCPGITWQTFTLTLFHLQCLSELKAAVQLSPFLLLVLYGSSSGLASMNSAKTCVEAKLLSAVITTRELYNCLDR